MAAGLTDAFDGDPRGIDLRQRRDFGNRGLEIRHGLRVRHVVTDVAAVERCLIRMLVEEIRRDADEAVAREALGEIAGVPHEAIAFVHEHDRGRFGVRRRKGEEGGKLACAAHGSGGDTGHRG